MPYPASSATLQVDEEPVLSSLSTPRLDWLIHPVGTGKFFEEYWERQTLVVRRNRPGYFGALLSLAEVDRVISTLDRRYPDITLKDARREITSGDYATQGGRLDVAKVHQLFLEGSTIALAFLDTVVPSLTLFCRTLENELGHPCQTNVYLTPPGAQGARPHYDTHDVFVLQVEGSKKWTIYGTPVELPLPGQDFDASEHELGARTLEFVLETGDAAYIPRGVVHEAQSADVVSLHITAGTDLLLETVAYAALHDPAFRKALPPGFNRSVFDRTQAAQTVRDLLERASSGPNFGAALDRFADEFIASRPPVLTGQMAQVAALDRLNITALAGARPGVSYRLKMDGDTASLRCYGREIGFPASTLDAVQFALNSEKFLVRDLPGNLDDAGKLTLVRRLIREGLVIAL